MKSALKGRFSTSTNNMNKINILHIKSKSDRFYVFDALDNNIYEIESEDDWRHIDHSNFGRESDIRDDALGISNIFDDVKHNAKTLILEITDECNIRCSYCVFDDSNKSERNHGTSNITKEKAFSEIVNFYRRTNGEDAYLVFYGGEPLLSYRLMVDLVEYSNKISGKKIKFSFTTNGISLNKGIFDFLVENDFKITVSIDGPKDIHDKRRATKNGKGTFSIIEENLNSLRLHNNEYYSNNIDFNCVLHDKKDFQEINDFFAYSDLFGVDKVRFSPEINESTKLDTAISASIKLDELKKIIGTRKSITADTFMTTKPKSTPKSIQNSFIGDIVMKIKHRKLDAAAKEGKKLCIPYANRTYVRVGGEIQFCERVQSYGILKSTSSMDEFSSKLHDEFYEFKYKSCSKCFAYNFCEMCPASFIENSRFSDRLSLEKCNAYRKNVALAMRIYINGMEDSGQ